MHACMHFTQKNKKKINHIVTTKLLIANSHLILVLSGDIILKMWIFSVKQAVNAVPKGTSVTVASCIMHENIHLRFHAKIQIFYTSSI